MISLSSPAAWLVLGLALLVPVKAATPADPPALETLRLMEVEGKVLIAADGSVVSAEVTTQRVAAPLREALLAKARDWHFKPVRVKGQLVQAQTSFRLVLAAKQVGEGFDVRIDGSSFGDDNNPNATLPDGVVALITGKKLSPPIYPQSLMMTGRTGSVMLAILVGADGRAEKVQVMRSLTHDFKGHLGEKTSRNTMRILEANAVAAARGWTFNVPPARATASPSERTVTVPVVYEIRYDVSQPGYWIPVHRGESRPIEWLPAERSQGIAFGGAGASRISAFDSPYQLLQPAAGTTLN